MQLAILPNGLLTDRERTWWLMQPFDLKLESRVIARALIEIVPRVDGLITVAPRIDGQVTLT